MKNNRVLYVRVEYRTKLRKYPNSKSLTHSIDMVVPYGANNELIKSRIVTKRNIADRMLITSVKIVNQKELGSNKKWELVTDISKGFDD